MGYSSTQANEMLMGLPGAMATETGRMLKATKTGIGNWWDSLDNTSKAAAVAGLVPGIGDAAGVANDARLFYQNPEMRTPANFGLSALGALPLIPSMGMVKGVGKNIVSASEKTPAFINKKKLAYGDVKDSTVSNALRNAFPDIYKNPKDIVAEAVSRVNPEHPLLQQLFGVSRNDLYEIGERGTRKGNLEDVPFAYKPKGTGSAIVDNINNPKNNQRILDILTEAGKQPKLSVGMDSWYVLDPAFKRLEEMYGKEEAIKKYNLLNAFTGMSSPGSDVITELNRGTAANMLYQNNRFDDFMNYAGVAEEKRGKKFPNDMRTIKGHAYHKTAQAPAMQKWINYIEGKEDYSIGDVKNTMDSAKVPTYISASGVPETGFQTGYPVGDAHFTRAIGIPDVRGAQTKKLTKNNPEQLEEFNSVYSLLSKKEKQLADESGFIRVEVSPSKSASVPEMMRINPYFKNISNELGIEAVPAQARLWGAASGATGVDSPIGLPKLELLAIEIGKAAKRMNVTPETARDLILSGKAHAGFIEQNLLNAMAATGLAGTAGYKYYNNEKDK
jgi:hypothetical protein